MKSTRKWFWVSTRMVVVGVSFIMIFGSLSFGQGKYPDPSRSIDYVIPFAPGGVTDISSRIFGDELSKALKVPVTPINKPGGGGTHGATLVAKGTKDGYNLLGNSISGMVLAPVVLPKVEFDTLKDFVPIVMFASTPQSIIVKPDSPYKDIQALIEAAKKNPGKLSYGSAGVGTDSHFNVEILSSVANVKFKHVPFKGSGEVGPAVMGSHVDFGTGAATTFLPLLKGEQVRALAITGKVRMKQLPDAKTFDEQGIKGDFVDNWTGFFAPIGTPQAVIDVLIQASQQVLKNKEFIDRIEKAGGMVVPNTAAEFKAIIQRDKKTAEEIAKKVGMTQPK